MKTPSGPHNTACKLSQPVRQRLNRFALAPALAGVALIALAWPAKAEVVYTPVHVTLSGNGSIKLDLNHDGITDFTVHAVAGYTFCAPSRRVFEGSVTVTPTKGNGVVTNGRDASRLNIGDQIDSSDSFDKARAVMTSFMFSGGIPPCSGHFGGDWCPSSNSGLSCQADGYLGLAFQINDQTHYGWALMSIYAGRSGSLRTTLTGFAYETIPGQAIKTGQTSGTVDDPTFAPDSANPEDSGFAGGFVGGNLLPTNDISAYRTPIISGRNDASRIGSGHADLFVALQSLCYFCQNHYDASQKRESQIGSQSI